MLKLFAAGFIISLLISFYFLKPLSTSKTIVKIDIAKVIKQQASALTSLNEQDLQKAETEKIKQIKQQLNAFAQKHKIIILHQSAVLTGVTDWTNKFLEELK